MACCGQNNRCTKDWDDQGLRRVSFLAGLVLLVAGSLFSLAAAAVMCLLWPVNREARVNLVPFLRALVRSRRDSAARLLDVTFLVSREVRCRLSGRLYPVSPGLAGFLFRYFNLILFAVVAAAILGATWGGWALLVRPGVT